jgi:hypothetical protein
MIAKLLLLFALVCSVHAQTSTQFPSKQTPTEIEIKDQQNTGQGPRSSSQIPITAYVISNTIYITFSNDLGDVDVTLEEASQGIILQTSVDSSELSAILPFGGAAGEYTISFSFPTGALYIGVFSIIL